MDFEQARSNMIEQQIRTWEVLDQRVLDALSLIKREDFIPDKFKKLALSDVNIPLAHGQITMQPKVEARIVQILNITPDDNILEIGTGCGYLTSVLASFGQNVVSLDIFPEFTKSTSEIQDKYKIKNVDLVTADGINGWKSAAPYDVIVVTGSLPVMNIELQYQLNTGGRLFAVTGTSPVMDATLITRIDEDQWSHEVIFETDLPPLIGAKEISKFHF